MTGKSGSKVLSYKPAAGEVPSESHTETPKAFGFFMYNELSEACHSFHMFPQMQPVYETMQPVFIFYFLFYFILGQKYTHTHT